MLAATLAAIRDGVDLPTTAPADSLQTTRVMARVGMSLTDYTRAYRIGHAVLWEAILEELERHDELDRTCATSSCAATSDLLFRYVDRITEILAGEYMRERDRVMRRREHKFARLAREILAGAARGPTSWATTSHCTTSERLRGETRRRQHMQALAERLVHVLCVPVSGEVVWGWLGSERPHRRGCMAHGHRLGSPRGHRARRRAV